MGKERLWGGSRRPTSPANVIMKILDRKTPDIGGRTRYHEVPEYLWDILYRCWDFNPEARPSVDSALQEYRHRTRRGTA